MLDNTYGIIFLATPHRGADLAKTLHRIQKATFFEQKFVGDLQLGCKSVNKINKVFAELYDQLALVSFRESKETQIIGVLSLIFRD